MCELRILLTNEPRSYREAIASVIRALKSNTEAFVAGPEELEAEVRRLSPQLVVCSHATPTVELRSLVWVELYPDHGSISTVSIDGEHSTVADIELVDLVSTVDRAEYLAKTG